MSRSTEYLKYVGARNFLGCLLVCVSAAVPFADPDPDMWVVSGGNGARSGGHGMGHPPPAEA